MTAPTSGATQNSHSCPPPEKSANSTGAVDRAGFRPPPVTGPRTASRTAYARPTAKGAAPERTPDPAVAPRNTAVSSAAAITSSSSAPASGKPRALSSPKLLTDWAKIWLTEVTCGYPLRAVQSTKTPKTAPISCATTYGATAIQGVRPATAEPTVMAGLKCPPET